MTTGVVSEEEWMRAGLSVLATDADTSVILFASGDQLQEFRRRLGEYEGGAPQGQRNRPYASLIDSIEQFEPLGPNDRIGPHLRRRGWTVESFADNAPYTLDVELWDTGPHARRVARVNELSALIEARGGDVVDRYVGNTLTLFRVSATGTLIRFLLDLDDVASVDEMPAPEHLTAELLEMTLQDLPAAARPDGAAPSIGILDSGLSAAHPLIAPAVGVVIGVPDGLGSADVRGHGTRVASIALYGDIRSCVENQQFTPEVRVHSAKIVNDQGRFDDRRLVISQVRDAMVALNQAGCRIFNMSLCDPSLAYDGGKLTAWAAALDELAREMNVVIVLASGNYSIQQIEAEAHVRNYPRYLVEPHVRILDPATAAIPLTVGAIAERAAVPPRGQRNVSLQPVAAAGEPSPFTRSGPGINETLKPDLCDFGGNLLFDGATQSLVPYDECAIMSFCHEYLRRLFMTAVGSSLAAPRVAHKAALVLRAFPAASANLVRALLASSASVPAAAIERLRPVGADAVARLCGYGVPDVSRAVTSNESRVVLYADDTIALDRFYVYEVPIPQEFVQAPGERYIQITLAYDPPTRHTRVDYFGTTMSYRLIRGARLNEVTEHYRRRAEAEGPVPEMPGRSNCDLIPGPAIRDRGTLQRSIFTMRQNPRPGYGDTYYLVVRCEGKWAGEEDGPQRFALVVEIGHPAVNRLYERLRERLRIRVQV